MNNLKFIKLAETMASFSKDKHTKVGCVIIGPDNEIRSGGYNGFPRGINDDIIERYERPLKYTFTAHSEENAIVQAARVGIPLKDCTMYLQWFPCATCTRMIINAGIIKIVVPEIKIELTNDPNRKDWNKDFVISKQMLEEAKVQIITYKEEDINGYTN